MAGLKPFPGLVPFLVPVSVLVLALILALVPPRVPRAAETPAAATLPAERLFAACSGCHATDAGAPHGVGPNLHGLAGRRAGTAEGFAYSPALQAAELTWDRGTLTAWIVATEDLVPGTWMLYHNVLEPAEVERLVDWLLAEP